MSLDGLRAWIGEVERKLGMRTRVFLALTVIAIGIGGAAIYLAIDAGDNSVGEDDLQALQQQLEGQVAAGGVGEGGTEVAQLESELRALQAEVAELKEESGGGSSKGSGTSGGGSGASSEGSGANSGGAAGEAPTGGVSGASTRNAPDDGGNGSRTQELLEGAQDQSTPSDGEQSDR
jgi:hypothetical protein